MSVRTTTAPQITTEPSSSSPLSAAQESSSPALFFRFPAGPRVGARASWPRPHKAALGHSIAAAPQGSRPATDASQARPAAPGQPGPSGFPGRFCWQKDQFHPRSWGRRAWTAFFSCKRSLEGVRGRWRWAAEEPRLARASPALPIVIKGPHPQHLLSSALHSSTAAGISQRFLTMLKKKKTTQECSASFSLEAPPN